MRRRAEPRSPMKMLLAYLLRSLGPPQFALGFRFLAGPIPARLLAGLIRPALLLPQGGAIGSAVLKPLLNPLENTRGPHAASDAHAHYSVTRIPPLHLVQKSGGELGASAAERMSQRNRPAVDVQAIRVDRQF